MYVGMRVLLMGILLLSKILNVARLLRSFHTHSLQFATLQRTTHTTLLNGYRMKSQVAVFVKNQADAGTINRT